MIKKLSVFVMAIWAVVCLSTVTWASEVEIGWSFPVVGEENISGFTIYKRVPDGKIEKLVNIDPATRSATFEDDIDPQCSNYFVVAVDAEDQHESLSSNVAATCPEGELPDMYTRPDAPTDTTATIIINLNIAAPTQ